VQALLGLANSSRIARRIVREEDRPILVDVGHGAVGHPLMNQIEKRAARGFDERQPFAIPSMGVAKKNFGSSVVLVCGRQALRTALLPINERHGDSGSEEQQ
jgi:hypothetical protein